MKRILSNMKISRALLLSYGIILGLFVAMMALTLVAVHQNAATTEAFYNRPYQVSKSAVALKSTVAEATTGLSAYVNESDASARADILAALDDLAEQRQAEMDIIASSFAADQELLARFQDANEQLLETRDEIIARVQIGDQAGAQQLLQTQYEERREKSLTLAQDIIDVAENTATTFVADSNSLETHTLLIIGVAAVVIIVIILFMWRRIVGAIVKPIEDIEASSIRVAQGDLSSPIPSASRNELGRLAQSLNTSTRSLQAYIEEIGRVLDELGAGNLETTPAIEFIGDYRAIGEALDRITASLRGTIAHLAETSEQVARSSSQMSDGAQVIAQGSAEQAMAVEELATNAQSIEQVAGDNAARVAAVNDSTAEVLEAVEGGNDRIMHTAQLIDAIKANTQNIDHLANGIEDIAFQTNILALNASVEAARAGEAGRGFSMVAEEIRRLAAQVSKASQEAGTLAARAIASIEEGDASIEAAAEHMAGAVAATESVKERMAAITQTSRQQLEAVAQIRESMDRVSDVVQENSAAAEESAVIAEELAQQAGDLRALMNRFEFDHTAAQTDAERRR